MELDARALPRRTNSEQLRAARLVQPRDLQTHGTALQRLKTTGRSPKLSSERTSRCKEVTCTPSRTSKRRAPALQLMAFGPRSAPHQDHA